jgi:hypothetical protein
MTLTAKAASIGLIVAASLTAQGDPTPGKDVPPDWLQGDVLVVSKLNFSVRCPVSECRWQIHEVPALKGTPTTMLVPKTRSGEPQGYVITVWDSRSNAQKDDELTKRQFLRGMEDSGPNGWENDGDVQITASTIPYPNSWRFKIKRRRTQDGAVIHEYGYVVPDG